MGLMSCSDCGNQVSTEAAFCTNCGRPIGRQRAQEGFLHKFARFNVFLVLGFIILMCGTGGTIFLVVYSSLFSSDSSAFTTPDKISSNSDKNLAPTPDTIANTSSTPSDTCIRITKKAYKIGYERGLYRDALEVKNTGQVRILAEAAADLVHQPAEEVRGCWISGWIRGYITSYNKTHANNPIRTASGEVATATSR